MNPTPPEWPTRNGLPETLRRAMIALLNRQLVDLIDLGLQAKQAHWNVKGPHFGPLHELFDRAAEALAEATDEVAERAVEIGGIARGTLQEVAGGTRVAVYPATELAGAKHVIAFATALAGVAGSTRAAIDTAAAAGDADTADVFTEVSRALDKLLWQVEAHAWPE